MFLSNFQDALYAIPSFLIAISIHEFAHGKAAHLLGDPTAKSVGRLTLNPFKHIDPLGLLMIALFGFGWAKPVPVNPLFLRGNRRKAMLLVAAAGPAANFALALLAGLGLATFDLLGWGGLAWFFFYLLLLNVYLGLFNLLPVPPLDGSKILFNALPPRHLGLMYELERYSYFILVLMLVTGIHRLFLVPTAGFFIGVITDFSAAVVSLFF
ncbi:MAG TPA: site-2 protease family protein [Bacillota bacterium]|nr:site-2 protease family protein [Bacillota bacterium]HPZ89771.1 site-2 protease family protein [Bacillota bacterium]HQE01213.1 site-2 protease family protein [Bacillota bacterium]